MQANLQACAAVWDSAQRVHVLLTVMLAWRREACRALAAVAVEAAKAAAQTLRSREEAAAGPAQGVVEERKAAEARVRMARSAFKPLPLATRDTVAALLCPEPVQQPPAECRSRTRRCSPSGQMRGRQSAGSRTTDWSPPAPRRGRRGPQARFLVGLSARSVGTNSNRCSGGPDERFVL